MLDSATTCRPSDRTIAKSLCFADALEAEKAMLDRLITGESQFERLLWETARCVVVPRGHIQDARFSDAARKLRELDYPVYVRETGGGAIVQGPGVFNVSLAFLVPVGQRDGIKSTYDRLCNPLISHLRSSGFDAGSSFVPGSMCDGAYNLAVSGRKLAGTAQRWRKVESIGACAVVAHLALFVDVDYTAAVAALNTFYACMGRENHIRVKSHINWTEFQHIDPDNLIARLSNMYENQAEIGIPARMAGAST